MRPQLVALLVAVLAAGLTACTRADERASDTGATTLTVYASLPLQGAAGPDSEAVANGARLALREAGGRVGELVVKLAVLDSSLTSTGRWDPAEAAENARTVIRDRTAIAYLGDGPSGATAIALPLLNAAGVPQVSPTSGYQGLTSSEDAGVGEPESFYPSGVRSFARPVPAAAVQARALMAAVRDKDCRRLQLLEDGDLEGRGLATAVERLAREASIAVVGRERVGPRTEPRRLAAVVAERDADCVVVAAALAPSSARLFDALHRAVPRAELLGSDGLASEDFATALEADTQARTQLTAPPGVLEPSAGVRDVVRDYRAAFGVPARSGALYGHEAMKLLLAAIERAEPLGADRAAVTRALFSLGPRQGPFGVYRIGPAGDTTSVDYSLLGVRGGRLVLRRTAPFGPG